MRVCVRSEGQGKDVKENLRRHGATKKRRIGKGREAEGKRERGEAES